MGLKLKRLLAILIACSAIIGMCATPIYAQESEISAECAVNVGIYRISGKGNSDYINVVVMPADDSVDDLTTQKLNQSDYISFSIKNNADGFEKSFAMPQDFADGEYKSVIWDGAEKLELYFMIGSDAYKNALISEKIKSDMLDEVIKRYGYQYGIDNKEYEELKQSVKSAVGEELAKNEINDFAAQYKASVLKVSFEQLENTQEVYNVLVMLETDFTDYNSIGNDEQQAVLRKLLKNLPDTQERLKSLAEQYSRESRQQQNATPRPNGSSGGRGQSLGFSPGSSIAAVTGATPEPTNSQAPSSQQLSDISEHWAKDNITELFKMGVVSGSDDGKFYPENNITRAEFSKMFAGVIGIRINSDIPQRFSDTDPSAWYYGYVMSLCQQGIMTGYTDDAFGPNNNITRQEMTAAIYRFLEKSGIAMDDEAEFSDIDEVSEYARTAVLKLGGADIISGYDGKFNPIANLTRAEAATVMLRTYKKLESSNVSYTSDRNNDAAEEEGSVNRQTLLVTTEMTKQEARIAEAEQLIAKLLERPLRGVTRAGFISDVYDLAKHIEVTPTEQYFTDLPLSREETASVQAAADMGFIARGKEFCPDDIITGYDAIRAIVCALGYKEYAEAAGGWPIGYIRAAEAAELLDNVSNSAATAGELDEDSAKLMLLNMLQSRVIMPNDGAGRKIELVVGEKTLLERVYGIYASTGIVKETNLNSLRRTGISKQSNIIVGDENYMADEDDDYMPYLGYNVNAYHTEDNELFMLSKTEKNKTVTFPVDGTRMQDNLTVIYEDENDKCSYKYNLSNDYFFLYNGALSTRVPEQVLNETTEGTVEILDSDRDGKYDVVTINKPEYVVVDSISKINRLIYDKNSSKNVIDVFDDEVIFRVKGRNGNIRFLDISADETYEIYATEDKKLISLKLMSTMLAGNASGRESNKITVNGTEYKTTEYFNKYYSDILKLGKDYSFIISSDNRIIGFSQTSNDMQLGYITYVGWEEGREDESLIINIFTQNNKFESYIANNKIKADGESVKVRELYNKLSYGGAVNDQLVYYKTDDNGKITALDLAQVSDGKAIGEKKKEGDSLTKYKFSASSFLYRSTGELMYPSFNVSGSIVFIVPNDINDKDVFRVTNSSFFSDAKSYSNVTAYNLSQSGSAEVVVVRSDSSVPKFSASSSSFVIEEVRDVLNEDDEIVKQISGWADKEYKSYLIDSKISTYKASGEELGFGDVIRFYADGDVIKALVCDFDANEAVFARNNVADASDMNGGYKEFMYQFGEAYYVGDGYIYIGGGADGNDLSTSALRNFSANTTNVAVIDMQENTVRTGTLSDIKTYKNFGSGDIVLIRQRNLLTMAIYVYVR